MMFPSMRVHLLVTSSRSAVVGRNTNFQVITVSKIYQCSLCMQGRESRIASFDGSYQTKGTAIHM